MKKKPVPINPYIIYDCKTQEYITPKRISFWPNGDFFIAITFEDITLRQEDYKGGHRFIVTQYGGDSGLTEVDVKNYIGRKNWKKFIKWMSVDFVQTVSANSKGETLYGLDDVFRFKERVLKGLSTYFD